MSRTDRRPPLDVGVVPGQVTASRELAIESSPECLAIGSAGAGAKRIVFAACRKVASAEKLGVGDVIDAPEDAAAIDVGVMTEKQHEDEQDDQRNRDAHRVLPHQ